MNLGGYEVREIKKWLIKRAMRELMELQGEFTQFDLHRFLSELAGRELTQGEKARATRIAREEACIKEVKIDKESRTKVYIFML